MVGRFAEHYPLDGQMVPVGGLKVVRLLGGDGLTITSTHPAIATVAAAYGPVLKPMRLFHITGVAAGTAFLEAKNSAGIVEARLELAVKAKKTVKVAFNFLTDTSGHSTVRRHGSVDGWIATMNTIFLPQVNVELVKHSVRDVQVNANLGSVVRFSSHLRRVPVAEHEWDTVVAKRDTSADFNIFFVWQYEQDRSPRTDNTQAGTSGSNCLFQDTGMRDIPENLAHETGHFLGADDTYASSKRRTLMYGYTDVRGRKIPKADANLMNP
jgi:hypothetical protein